MRAIDEFEHPNKILLMRRDSKFIRVIVSQKQ